MTELGRTRKMSGASSILPADVATTKEMGTTRSAAEELQTPEGRLTSTTAPSRSSDISSGSSGPTATSEKESIDPYIAEFLKRHNIESLESGVRRVPTPSVASRPSIEGNEVSDNSVGSESETPSPANRELIEARADHSEKTPAAKSLDEIQSMRKVASSITLGVLQSHSTNELVRDARSLRLVALFCMVVSVILAVNSTIVFSWSYGFAVIGLLTATRSFWRFVTAMRRLGDVVAAQA